jgi:hypothetical protein
MNSPLVESFVIFQQYSSLSRLFPSEFWFVFVKLRLICSVVSLYGFKSIVYMWMLTKILVCTNLFEGTKWGFPMWHQMGLGKMNHTFEETHNKAIPADPLDPLFRKWGKVHGNPITRNLSQVVSYITSKDPTTTSQKDDGSWVFTVGSMIGETNTTRVAYLFKSKDLKHWELVNNHLYTLPWTGMWECIDFYCLGPSLKKCP